jgi:hypothetical protein
MANSNYALTPANGEYVWIYLYDNNGTTLLNSSYSTTTFNQFTDGLAAGTYYVKVTCYYNTKFAPYAFADTLLPYTYANDANQESNAKPYLAKTLPSNGTTNGHIGFYYKNKRDSVDWWKINYTGTAGTMTINLNLQANFCCGNQHTWMYVYKDTTAAPIYSNYSTSNFSANLSSLTQGYYYVKVNTYYSDKFQAYTLNPVFVQVTKAKATLVAADTSAACDSTNSITIKCTKSHAPYTAQLYRYNLPYGNAVSIKNSQNFVFSNLPKGNYSVRVYGDGATGNALVTLPAIELMPEPTNTRTTGILATQARLNWNALSCANYFSIQYRKASVATWTTLNTNGNKHPG